MITDFDNTQSIPEPMLTNIKKAFGGGKNTYADTVLLEQGAQYGYNLAMVQVKDLEAVRTEYQSRVEKLEDENQKLRDQIKP